MNKLRISKIEFRIALLSVFIVLGIVLIYISKFENAYLNGFGIGLTIGGVIALIGMIRVAMNPKLKEQYINKEKDERNIFIGNKSYSSTFWLTIVVELIATCYYAIIDKQEISIIISQVICAQLVVSNLLYFYYNRKY